MKIMTMENLFEEEIMDLYSAEEQILEALPKMIKASKNKDLKEAFKNHLAQTEEQIQRLETISVDLGFEVDGPTCKGMKGIIQEGDEMITMQGEAAVRDAGIVGAAQRVEHYEIAGYGTAIAHAKLLEYDVVAKLLEKTLEEEVDTDKLLSKLAEKVINQEASNN